MSVIDGLTATQEARNTANIELLRLFMIEYMEHPEMTDEFPAKTNLFLLPDNDPDLCDYNLEMARKKAMEGKTVVLRAISVKP
ncbi:MAG: hypothetical protein QM692_10995 [Thermomicrobiales bacterium]